VFDPVRRRGIAEEVIGLATRFPNSRLVVTSRIAGFDPFTFDAGRFVTATLDDWDAAHIDRFARAWFGLVFEGQPEQAAQAATELQETVAARPQLLAIAGNPLLLTMMALVARHEALERSRVGLYEQALTTLSFTLDLKHKGLSLPPESPLRGLGPRDRLALLRHIAWTMQEQAGGLRANAITEDELHDALKTHLRDVFAVAPDDAGRAANEMIQILQERNWILTIRGPRLFGFVHRTFLEYLCASHLMMQFRARKVELSEIVANFVLVNAYDDTWHEVIRLLVGQLGRDGAEHARVVLEALLGDDSEPDADRVALALESLAEQEPTSLAALREEVSRAIAQLAELIQQWLVEKNFARLHRYEAALRGLALPTSLRTAIAFTPSILAHVTEDPNRPDSGPVRQHDLFVEGAELELVRAFWPPNEAKAELSRIAVRGWSYNRFLAMRLLSERFSDADDVTALLSDRLINDPSPEVRLKLQRLMDSRHRHVPPRSTVPSA
jgi:predicted NACHT family NTPase